MIFDLMESWIYDGKLFVVLLFCGMNELGILFFVFGLFDVK